MAKNVFFYSDSDCELKDFVLSTASVYNALSQGKEEQPFVINTERRIDDFLGAYFLSAAMSTAAVSMREVIYENLPDDVQLACTKATLGNLDYAASTRPLYVYCERPSSAIIEYFKEEKFVLVEVVVPKETRERNVVAAFKIDPKDAEKFLTNKPHTAQVPDLMCNINTKKERDLAIFSIIQHIKND